MSSDPEAPGGATTSGATVSDTSAIAPTESGPTATDRAVTGETATGRTGTGATGTAATVTEPTMTHPSLTGGGALDENATDPKVVHAQPPREELVHFHRALAEMCRSSLPLPRSLRLLGGELGRRELRAAVEAMARDVEEGLSVAEAYARRAEALPSLYGALIEAGVGVGELPEVLRQIAEHEERRVRTRDRIRRALVMPLCTLFFVVVCACFLLIAVGAPMSEQLDDLGTGSTLVAMSGTFEDERVIWGWSIGVGVGLLGLLGGAFALWLRDPLEGRVAGFGFRLPLLSRLRQHADRASFASTMSLLLRRQVGLADALRWTAATMPDRASRAHLEQLAVDVESGRPLGECLEGSPLMPPSTAWIVATSEPHGEVGAAMADLARVHERRLERATERMSTWTIPLLELAAAGVVAGLAASYAFPAFDLVGQVLGR